MTRFARIVALPALAALLSCAPAPPLAGSTHRLNAAACRAQGGSIDRRGMFGTRMCVTPFADAGRTCTDSDQCAGRCLIVHGGADIGIQTRPPGREAAGQCEADDRTFGCFAEIRGGRITDEICVD